MQFSRIAVVHNPAGGSANPKRLDALCQAFAEQGAKVVRYATVPGPAPGTTQALQAVADGSDLIVAVGGDGTVREVAEASRKTGVMMAAYQGGTSNVFAESFYATLEPSRFAAMIMSGIPQRIDLIEVEYKLAGADQERRELCLTGICTGPMAKAITGTSKRAKKLCGPLAYAVNAGLSFLQQRQTSLHFRTERQTWVADVTTAVVLNLTPPSYAKISRGCNASDGLLDLILFQVQKARQLPGLLYKLAVSRPDQSPHYSRYRVRELTISDVKPFDVNLDGEAVLTSSIKLTVLPQALPIVVA